MPPQVNTVYIYNKARLLDAQKWAQQHAVGCSEVGTAVPLSDAQKWARQGCRIGCSEVGTVAAGRRMLRSGHGDPECQMLRSGHGIQLLDAQKWAQQHGQRAKVKGPKAKGQRPKGR